MEGGREGGTGMRRDGERDEERYAHSVARIVALSRGRALSISHSSITVTVAGCRGSLTHFNTPSQAIAGTSPSHTTPS